MYSDNINWVSLWDLEDIMVRGMGMGKGGRKKEGERMNNIGQY